MWTSYCYDPQSYCSALHDLNSCNLGGCAWVNGRPSWAACVSKSAVGQQCGAGRNCGPGLSCTGYCSPDSAKQAVAEKKALGAGSTLQSASSGSQCYANSHDLASCTSSNC